MITETNEELQMRLDDLESKVDSLIETINSLSVAFDNIFETLKAQQLRMDALSDRITNASHRIHNITRI